MKTTNKAASNPLKTVFGPLWNLYNKDTVYEIIVDAHDDVYIATADGIKSEKIFKTDKDLNLFIDRLTKHSKKKIPKDELSYFFQLEDFTKINIVLPPLTVKGPSAVITKLPLRKITFNDLVEWDALTLEGKELIEKILASNKGILIGGNMGSGKTTLFNAIVNAIPQPNRVVTLERIPDLVLERPHTCRIQSQTQKASEMIELIGMVERMRADYVVLSECVGPEVGPFLEMVRNNCTGITLVSGENVFDVIKRMQTKTVLSSDGYSIEEANYALAQTFSYVIFQEKRADGKRVISSISETSYSAGELKLKILYKK